MDKRADAVHQLLGFIEGGHYPPQSRLPPERVLAGRLSISRAALRNALSVLEAQNRIWRHVGRGTFVGPRPLLEDSHSLTGVTNATNPAEILETRLVLEPKLAAMAALRATQNDLERMERCLSREESAGDFEAFEHWDGALHQAIAESTHNRLLISLFKAVNSLREEQLWGRLKKAAMNNKRQKAYGQEHRSLVDAIKHRDPADAERIMRVHLENIQKNMLGSI